MARNAEDNLASGGGFSPWPAYLGYALLYLLLLGPVVGLVLYAGSTRWFFPDLLPATWTFETFWRQLSNARTQQAIGTSLLLGGVVTLLALVIALPAARTLGLERFPGRSLVLLLLFLPTIVPPLATGMGLNIIFLRLGLAGSLAGVVLVHLIPVLPYTIFALIGVFVRYDEGYEQQARTLGAGPLRILWQVTLPLAGPGIAVAALFAFLVSWSQYVLTLLIGGGQVITLPMLLFAAVAGGNPATIAALALIFAGPPLVAIALAARALTERTTTVGQQY
ncbi:ABC transporter permease subunit [Candidatus Chloroploca sp. M-50]|uniref:ABC transporter permease subunit n=1 Tax=Candidatus Chloroploca mongolica TaxID=2528176 RepID=A0ABS4D416_9CHLR|nr:ABC transporter permease subunit [Candidatus Chloroploca mongolica]MBP1464172.1 ABC transporter permease subunit [Candidatus Chloroploca mongolica]